MPAVMLPATVPSAAVASLTGLLDGWGPWLFVALYGTWLFVLPM